VPLSIRSYHVTLLTALWSGLVLVGDALAVQNRRWLFAVSAIVAIQYLTDAVDGKLGVLRGDGLVRWGFYTDHLLDYAFLCAILLGYTLLVPTQLQWMMTALLAVAIGFMVSSFLACAVEGNLGISYLRVGPVEIRLLFIAINTWLALGGRAPLETVLPMVLVASLTALCALVVQTQRRLWRLDNHRSAIQIANGQSTIRESPIAIRQATIV
jgi:archaetidylinositol phosphate synthase